MSRVWNKGLSLMIAYCELTASSMQRNEWLKYIYARISWFTDVNLNLCPMMNCAETLEPLEGCVSAMHKLHEQCEAAAGSKCYSRGRIAVEKHVTLPGECLTFSHLMF